MKYQRKIDGKARCFQVNTKQRETNEQQEGKECETRGQEVENTKNHRVQKYLCYWCGRFMKLLEVKATIMKLRCATYVKLDHKNHLQL